VTNLQRFRRGSSKDEVMEGGVGRRIWGEPGSYPGQDTVKLTVFVGFPKSFLQSKAEGSDGEK
jgi:hypothetical protein